MTVEQARSSSVPRDRADDYTEEQAARRRDFVRDVTGVGLRQVGSYSPDRGDLPGNVESFTGVAQVPIGLAGPLPKPSCSTTATTTGRSRCRP